MNSFVWMALVATLGTWLVTALGAATVVFFTSPRLKALNLMLGFSAGVMIAASFWSLLEPAISPASAPPGVACLAGGNGGISHRGTVSMGVG